MAVNIEIMRAFVRLRQHEDDTPQAAQRPAVNSQGRKPLGLLPASRSALKGRQRFCHAFGVPWDIRSSSRGLRPWLLTIIPSGFV